MSLERRVKTLEGRARLRSAPSPTELQAWALADEIARLEAEMEAAGQGSWPYCIESADVPDGLTLQEEIEWLEGELETESWD